MADLLDHKRIMTHGHQAVGPESVGSRSSRPNIRLFDQACYHVLIPV